MNYVILNDIEYYQNNIMIDNFQEVSLNGKDRIDGVFGTIFEEVLEQSSQNTGGRNQFFEEEWLCRDRGVQFVVIRVPQNILYTEHQEYIQKCFELFNKESFYIELWSTKLKDKEKYEYFIIGYNKNFDFTIIFENEFDELEENEIIKYISKKIEKNLFKK